MWKKRYISEANKNLQQSPPSPPKETVKVRADSSVKIIQTFKIIVLKIGGKHVHKQSANVFGVESESHQNKIQEQRFHPFYPNRSVV